MYFQRSFMEQVADLGRYGRLSPYRFHLRSLDDPRKRVSGMVMPTTGSGPRLLEVNRDLLSLTPSAKIDAYEVTSSCSL